MLSHEITLSAHAINIRFVTDISSGTLNNAISFLSMEAAANAAATIVMETEIVGFDCPSEDDYDACQIDFDFGVLMDKIVVKLEEAGYDVDQFDGTC